MENLAALNLHFFSMYHRTLFNINVVLKKGYRWFADNP